MTKTLKFLSGVNLGIGLARRASGSRNKRKTCPGRGTAIGFAMLPRLSRLPDDLAAFHDEVDFTQGVDVLEGIFRDSDHVCCFAIPSSS